MTSRIPLFVCLITITATGRASAASNSVVESGDAYVSHESGVQWIIGNARLRIGVAAEVGSDFHLVVIGIPQIDDRPEVTSIGSVVTVDDRVLRVGRREDGFRVSGISGGVVTNGVRLDSSKDWVATAPCCSRSSSGRPHFDTSTPA